jgi:hypothetical protein
MNKLPLNFDHIFYSNYYNDLNKAFGYNKDLLQNHYLNCGIYENRKYCDLPINFNWEEYIVKNPDVFDTIEKNNKQFAIHHFLENKTNISNKPIFIVYYAYLNNEKDWRTIIKGQIEDVYKSGIFNYSLLHTVLCGDPNDIKECKKLLENIIKINIEVTEVYENKYEFPAIIKIRELALEYPDKLFIYFHSKGMVFNNQPGIRTHLEQRLTNNTFLDWESTLLVFKKFPQIQKAALLPSKDGFGWFNFWWARGIYLISCKPIKIPENLKLEDRYLCEGWLGQYGSNTWEDCYSIITKNIWYSKYPWDEIWTKI